MFKLLQVILRPPAHWSIFPAYTTSQPQLHHSVPLTLSKTIRTRIHMSQFQNHTPHKTAMVDRRDNCAAPFKLPLKRKHSIIFQLPHECRVKQADHPWTKVPLSWISEVSTTKGKNASRASLPISAHLPGLKSWASSPQTPVSRWQASMSAARFSDCLLPGNAIFTVHAFSRRIESQRLVDKMGNRHAASLCRRRDLVEESLRYGVLKVQRQRALILKFFWRA